MEKEKTIRISVKNNNLLSYFWRDWRCFVSLTWPLVIIFDKILVIIIKQVETLTTLRINKERSDENAGIFQHWVYTNQNDKYNDNKASK